jgi:hypothetical protein
MARRMPSAATATVLLALVGGMAVRLWSLATPALQLDGDQAVTGLMVDNIVAGRSQYVFVAGQNYNGALEQWLQAAMYWALPLPRNGFTLRLVDVALMAAACWLTYAVGRRMLDSSWRAALAAVLMAFAPYWTFAKGSHSDGAYPSLLIVGLLSIYCALRLLEDRRLRWAAAGGFFAGAVLWLGQSGIELLVPALLIALPVLVRSVRAWLVALPAALLGMAPSIAWSLRHHNFAAVDIHLQTPPTSLGTRVHNVFGAILREFIGVAGLGGAPGWPYLLQHLIVAVLAVTFLVAVYRRRRGVLAVITARVDGRTPVDALLVSVPIVAVLYVSSRSAWDNGTPKYLFVFTPVLLWLLAAAVPRRPPALSRAVAAGLAVVMVATSMTMLVNRHDKYPGTSDAELRTAIRYLVEHNYRDVYAEFWTAMPMLYLADGALDIAPLRGGKAKFVGVFQRVYSAPSAVYVDSARTNGNSPVDRPPVEAMLRLHHIAFQKVLLGTVIIWSHLSPMVRPWQIGIGRAPT